MMKKFILFLCVGLFLVNCSNQDFTESGEFVELMNTDSLGYSYMCVRIVSSGTTGTRAEIPEETYQDGYDYENYVSKVRFFFFYDDINGTVAADIFKKDGSKVSYYDWDLTSSDNENNKNNSTETVEKILEHTLQFRVDIGSKMPTRVLAVLNPTEKILKLEKPSLKDLQEIAEDYEGYEEATGKKLRAPRSMKDIKENGYGFVMSNSVYADEKNELSNTTICEGKFYSDPKTAEDSKNKLTITVERVLARIDLSIAITKGVKEIKPEDGSDPFYIYATGQKLPDDALSQNETEDVDDNGKTDNDDDEEIYVRFLGWNVFDTPTSSRLIKEIDVTNWTGNDNVLFGYSGEMHWNSLHYKRSYWAINPLGVQYRIGSFSNGKAEPDNDQFTKNDDYYRSSKWTIMHNEMPAPTIKKEEKKIVTDYFQENASPSINHTTKPEIPSQVVIAAQLVNSDGVAQTLAKWGGKTYTVKGLKKEFAYSLNMWKKAYEVGDRGETKTTYTPIDVDDLIFEEEENPNKLTVKLKDEQGQWFEQSATNSEVFTLIADPTATVENKFGKGNVRIWTNGYAYFYFKIRHLGEKEDNVGYYGVVRNHIYDATVTSIAGLGVPVNKPEDVIIETDPTEEDWYLDADVKILQWRVVKHDYDLNW